LLFRLTVNPERTQRARENKKLQFKAMQISVLSQSRILRLNK